MSTPTIADYEVPARQVCEILGEDPDRIIQFSSQLNCMRFTDSWSERIGLPLWHKFAEELLLHDVRTRVLEGTERNPISGN